MLLTAMSKKKKKPRKNNLRNNREKTLLDIIQDSYIPQIVEVGNLLGFTIENIPNGKTGHVLTKSAMTSYDKDFSLLCSQIPAIFSRDLNPNELNKLLVVIKKETAYIYKNYPFGLGIRIKRNIKSMAVFRRDILDINSVNFRDAIFNLNLQDGDKIFWLFRNEFSFGMYFDFTGKLELKTVYFQMGNLYRRLEYYRTYSFLENKENFQKLIERGWFPFSQLIGKDFENLLFYVVDENNYEILISNFIKFYTSDKIASFTEYWWNNPVFENKKTIIKAGIDSFLQDNNSGNINCIKNLFSEIEGIIMLAYVEANGRKPSTTELKKFVVQKANDNFLDSNSLSFPNYFYAYLNDVIFKDFDLINNDVAISRHSVNHGVASSDSYSREKALQLILTLDQIYFYLG